METIKVNMNPNPLDVQTIHASQNDTEARQWGFELHNNGELIDTSEITEQLFFKAYKGGTEQILPENTSTPTTSPFKGDIKYPQGLLSDQEFLYRESPTEEDGLAKITDIKGNTLVWNQLAPSMSSSMWVANRCTKTVSGNTFSLVGTNNALMSFGVYIALTNLKLTVNHDYLFMCVVNANRGTQVRFTFDRDLRYTTITPNQDNVYSRVVSTATEDPVACYIKHPSSITTSDTVTVKNLMIVDLTMLNDSRITDFDSFRTYYPLSYYPYTNGKLLSFNGNGIKTVGKNQFNSEHSVSATNVVESSDNGTITIKDVSSAVWSNAYIGYSDVIVGETYTFKATLMYGRIGGCLSSTSYPTSAFMPDTSIGNLIFSVVTAMLPSRTFVSNFTGRIYWWYCTDVNNANHQQFTMQPMVSTTDADFEPYKETITGLPTLTYFPNGLKSVGSVYDELTPNKATTRLKEVTFSSVSAFDSSGKLGVLGSATDAVNITGGDEVPNDRAVLETYSMERLRNNDVNGITQFGRSFFVRLQGKTTLAEYNTYLSANPLSVIYELATPTETSFTTASLVTENAEIPLSNEDGVLIGKCTEELSENPGFIDAKIKLSDADGTCYSNKLQLHVERSPQ